MPQMIRMSLTDAHNAGYNIQNRKNIGANVANKNLNVSQKAPSKIVFLNIKNLPNEEAEINVMKPARKLKNNATNPFDLNLNNLWE
jgi:hypothetical protein